MSITSELTRKQRARERACDHVRQYWKPGNRLPCAVPSCPDGILGENMCQAWLDERLNWRPRVWIRTPSDNSWEWRRMSIRDAAEPQNLGYE